MTKDEALKILPDMKGAGDDWDKAIDLAVEALKQANNSNISNTPNTPNTLKSLDCVDRQTLIDALLRTTTFGNVHELNKFVQKYHLDREHMGGLRDAVFAIVNAPSVQPEPLWGKTVEDGIPLADHEIVSRLRDIQKQVGGSYAIDRAIEVIEAVQALPPAQPELCEDAVSREAVSKWLKQYWQDVLHGKYKFSLMYIWKNLMNLPSAHPTYTDAEVQKMQDLHQAEIEKAFELGKESAKAETIHCGECIHADYARKDVMGRIYCLNHGFYWDALAYCSYAERRTDGEIIPE